MGGADLLGQINVKNKDILLRISNPDMYDEAADLK